LYEEYLVPESDDELSSSNEEQDEMPKVSLVTLGNIHLDPQVHNSTAALVKELGRLSE
jgi:hypothetical protein